MSAETLGISSFYTVEDLQLALAQWPHKGGWLVYGPNGEQITGFAVRAHVLTDGSKVTDLHFMAETQRTNPMDVRKTK